jgi:hypothetical protein
MAAEGSVARGERSGAASQLIECQYPGSSRRPIQSWIAGASSSATATGHALAYVYFGAAAKLLSTRPGASPPTSPSCRGCCAGRTDRRIAEVSPCVAGAPGRWTNRLSTRLGLFYGFMAPRLTIRSTRIVLRPAGMHFFRQRPRKLSGSTMGCRI